MRACENCKHRIMKVEVGKGTSPEHFWGCECCECEFEPTTKNDLGVDCISRAEALGAIRNLYPSMPRVDFSGSLRKWVDKYKPYIECEDAIEELPSVTPQPRWIPVSERLPEPDVEVLVTDDAGGLATISTDSIYESEVTGEKEWYASQNVTAWMPLPKPYEPQESEEV